MTTRTRSTPRFLLSILLPFFINALLFAQPPATSQSRAAAIWDSMPVAKAPEQVAISPDGEKLAWTDGATVFISPFAPGAAIKSFIAPNNLPVRDLQWSPDSARIAFIADLAQEKPAAELYLTDLVTTDMRGSKTLTSSQPSKLADFQGYVSTPRFSPDGKTLAVLFIENMPRVAGALVPMTPPEGVIEERYYEQRLTTVDVASRTVRQVSPPDMYVYEYDWSPDGKSWAASAAHGSGDNNWWIARLYTIDAQLGTLREVHHPKLQIAIPRFSPDGKNIAFVSGIMSDFGVTGGDVFVVPATGGEARNLTPGMKASATWLAWTSPSDVLFTANIDGNAGVASVSTGGGMKTVWQNFEFFYAAEGEGLSLARDGKTAATIRNSFSAPPEIWAGAIGDWKQITNYNAGVKPAWGEARNVHWTSDGQRIQGWLLFPRAYDPKKKYPMIVTVHGGPASACMPRWDVSDGAFSAMDYFVLCPNIRGSYGQGEAFTYANVKDFGGGDFRDIMNGIDSLAREYPIDLDRLGIRGHSYGGYMTMWAETQTYRFKAAVAGAGLSDWLSYYGENDIDEWMIPYFGASVYDEPKVYDKSSPILFVKSVKTPTLILVGDRDGEVPAPQSFEWWHALKTLNVPNQFVVYPNEGHAIAQPEHRRDYQVRSMEWFEKWFAK
jgi:dipeptidyl aminopeptidase/acylaminoacyl peptidase